MITFNVSGYLVNSKLVGLFDRKIMRIDYQLQLDHNWNTLSVTAKSRHGENTNALSFASDGNANWSFNDKPVPEFAGCIDIDISVTPFTNTLPINRLKLNINESRDIKVIYINLPAEELNVMEQRYTKISDTEYVYENTQTNFKAIITTDNNGIVTNYPGIFERIGVETL
jgi:hypothetical protein